MGHKREGKERQGTRQLGGLDMHSTTFEHKFALGQEVFLFSGGEIIKRSVAGVLPILTPVRNVVKYALGTDYVDRDEEELYESFDEIVEELRSQLT